MNFMLYFLQICLWGILLLPINFIYKITLSDYILISIETIISACLAIVSLGLAIRNKRFPEISMVDIIIACYAGYILFNSFFIRPLPVTNLFLLKFLSVCLIYISIRMMTDKQQRTGSLSIAIIGTLEAVLVILQNYGWVESEHLLFNCTGSFFNLVLPEDSRLFILHFRLSSYNNTYLFQKNMLIHKRCFTDKRSCTDSFTSRMDSCHHRIMLSFMAYG